MTARRALRAAALLALCCLLASCVPLTRSAAYALYLTRLSERCGVDLTSGGTTLSDKDTHGGFLGDGERLTRICRDAAFAAAVAESPRWKPLPFGEELADWTEAGGLGLLPDEWPAEGYYCFDDRQAEAFDPEGERAAFLRPSLNFTLFVYDTETNVLTVYALDT